MQPMLVLSHAWKEALGWSDSEVASFFFFDLDLANAVATPAGEGDVCPQCRRNPVDSIGWIFVHDPATSTAAQVKGRQVVMCLCKTTYSVDAVHAVDVGEPIGRAVVRAVSAPQPALPPGANTTLDEANRIANQQFVTNQRYPYVHAAIRQLLFSSVPPETPTP